MPDPLFHVKARGSGAAAQPRGGLRSGLVGLFILVCLLLPRLLWMPLEQPGEYKHRAADAWLDFFDPEVAILEFEAAPPLDVGLGLVRRWPNDAEAVVQLALLEKRARPWLPEEVDRLYGLEDQISPARRVTDAGQFNYRVTPSFNFEQQGLKPSGVVIRLWINF